jgi:hypothetical protein
MQPSPTRPGADGVGYMSERRFRPALPACASALVPTVAHSTVGLGPIWARVAAPVA